MLLPGPECVMGPRTDSSCCCQARNLPWAPVPPPHAAARSRVCHGSLYGLPLLLLQARNLPWAPVPTPHAAARPVICHGPLYRLLMLLPGPECVMGPCTASHCCCLHRHTLPCATFRSPHTAGGSILS
ncbi:unnamed protein product [Staurois parvus]|uniref:Uncharacterized protein n=1 Tax=Staurois parvus TaxID=386267 RepID=A0ABN9G1A5_9NEOB|nr:unnamed protein product [Staurois parvus]